MDRLGDVLAHGATHGRRHNGVAQVWLRAKRAVADGAVLLGDKEKKDKFKMYNDDHVPDTIEIGAAPSGKDRLGEVRVKSPHSRVASRGIGTQLNGGCPASVGHSFAFGNTLEEEQCKVYGCRQRGRPTDPPFCHATGRGFVKYRKGQYRDAIVNKKNTVNLLLHCLYGGAHRGAVAHLHCLQRASEAHDGTVYDSWAAPSYVTHWGQALSHAAVFGDACDIFNGVKKLRGAAVATA